MNTHELAEYLLDFEPMEVHIGNESHSKPLNCFPTVVASKATLSTDVLAWDDVPEEDKKDYEPVMEFYID